MYMVRGSVSGTCRIPKRLLYTVRESTGFMGCIPAGRSWMGSRSNQPQVKLAPGQISPKSNRPHGGPCYIYIKLNRNTDIWLCSFPLMLRACWRSKNTNFYSLWFDIIISYRKMIFCLFLVAKAAFRVAFFQVDPWFLVAKLTYPMSINHWLWWIFVNVLKWIFNKGCRKNLGISGIWSCWFKGIWFVFTVFNRQ